MTEIHDAEDLFDPDAKKPDGTEVFLDAPVNASDPKQLKAKALNDKQRDLKQENDIRAILSSVEGVRFLARIVGMCGWNAPYFQQNNSLMCEVAGRRSIAWQIEQAVKNVDLSLWFAIERELETTRVKPKTSEARRS